MKSNIGDAGKSLGSQASKPSWMSNARHGMPSSRHTSAHVPLPAIGSNAKPGWKYKSKSLIRLPPQLPGHLRSPYSPARWKW
jgi:hypothetical protein